MTSRATFGAVTLALCAAGIFHAVALFVPSVAEPSPPWRHALFAGINIAFAIGMWMRPRGFVVLFAILTAQQLYSHATYAFTTWRDERRVDWASAVVLLAMPLVLVLLVRDRASRSR